MEKQGALSWSTGGHNIVQVVVVRKASWRKSQRPESGKIRRRLGEWIKDGRDKAR